MTKILLSGFEAFGELTSNPTMEIISRSKEWIMDGGQLYSTILPVIYDKCAKELIKKIEDIQPDYVLALGVAVGRSTITPERIGINIQDTVGEGKLGDNEGLRPKDRLIVEGGPDGLFSTLPIRQITEKLIENEIPATISNTAGTYICNNTLYSVLHYIKKNQLPIRAGFIHVPATPNMVCKQPNVPSMTIDLQEKGIRLIAEYCIKYGKSLG
ncbi:pyroglutamyl-peptidase I [Evansella sp. AB-P1]|uniref:pyroglutamyl-peptidase I n=1 Tax=Evansella sp. AB-P1 TaxID=3037653 RepID=UPI00241E9D15|nr:pyroglutamyl-peptidase I [Evansella sp. AB-P1]MDG5789214.1 pyroglutamyl-peptidase I [Evansella sp. AB-P1]